MHFAINTMKLGTDLYLQMVNLIVQREVPTEKGG